MIEKFNNFKNSEKMNESEGGIVSGDQYISDLINKKSNHNYFEDLVANLSQDCGFDLKTEIFVNKDNMTIEIHKSFDKLNIKQYKGLIDFIYNERPDEFMKYPKMFTFWWD